MKELKTHKGITLVALIITIVVLLILAMAGIGAVRDSKIIAHAQNAGDSYTIGQEKEQIGLAVSEWQLEKVIPGNNAIFKNVIENALQGQIEPIVENSDGSLTVTFTKTRNVYTVTKDGEINGPTPPPQPTQGITITPTTLTIKPGETAQVAATLNGGLTGTITYTSSDDTKALVNEEGVVTGVAQGIATITATCGDYNATCSVTVQEEPPVIVGVKAYQFGEQVSIVTPENELTIFSGELFPMATTKLTEDVSEYNITLTGFTDEEKSNLKFLTGKDMDIGAIIGYIGTERNTAYIGMITEGSTNVTISKEQYITHSDELLAQYYQDDANVEYYYGKWDAFEISSQQYSGGEKIYKVDNNSIKVYGKSEGESNWTKIECTIDKKETNGTEINITVGENPVIITTSALKIDYLVYGTKQTLYIQDGIIYGGNNLVEGAVLKAGWDTQSLVKYINTSLLPQ